jgi:hypothetical protein
MEAAHIMKVRQWIMIFIYRAHLALSSVFKFDKVLSEVCQKNYQKNIEGNLELG